MEYIYVVIDYGSSIMKVECDTAFNQSPRYFTMEPETIEIKFSAVSDYRSRKEDQVQASLTEVFVSVKDLYYAVGKLARQEFRATPNLAQLKLSSAVPRTLAAIWVAAQKCAVGKKFKLFLTCVLPPGEYEDRHSLKERLREALLCFDSPTGKLQVNMIYFKCFPEGAGLSMCYDKYRGGLGERKVGVIMMGHRNLSCFMVEDSIQHKFRSSDLGFSTVVLEVQSRTSGYKERDITAAIAPYLLSPSKDQTTLEQLLLQNTPSEREEELAKLVKAIDLAVTNYGNAVVQWLTVQLPNIDELTIGGGAAKIIKDVLANHYRGKLPNEPGKNNSAVYFNGALKYPSDTLVPLELQARFADVQCLWECNIIPTAQAYWEQKKKKG